ncbi:MBL fold metallo-hydrolase [Salinilacihabitans rarus]|uniref:MBL fold metallo-hydrolase n=1 Tax=Salinilacihabitans rarus TaxID=2961596 RepID=UPI0020C8FFFD|nr:MBL fold metallo-hydrolase [Salinilacihabitans rarus]
MEVTRRPVPTATRAPGGRTNAYVLGRDPALLVDPAGRTDALDRLVADRGVEHVLVTHAHPDHVDAVAAYADGTDATVWARYGRTDRFREATGADPDRTFLPGTTIPLGDGDARVVDAPGHAPDHVAVVAGDDGPVCCGDCAVREGSVVVGAPEGDMRAYLSTLRRLHARDPPRLLPGHGPVVDDPRATLERLIAHRLERERRVLAAVDAGARHLDEVLDAAYGKDLTGVADLARATVVAHLEKLAVEGRLAWDGKRERARPAGD